MSMKIWVLERNKNMNPIEMIKNIKSPQQFLNNFMNNNSNPMLGQLLKMAQTGNSKEIEAFARNILKEKGRDFDKEFSDFIKQVKK